MIRYKVTRTDRASCIVYPYDSKFCHYYIKGETIKANPETLGIFTFKTHKEASNFLTNHTWLILRVKPIGKGKTPKIIAPWANRNALEEFYEGGPIKTNEVPKGTICYPAVKVLD